MATSPDRPVRSAAAAFFHPLSKGDVRTWPARGSEVNRLNWFVWMSMLAFTVLIQFLLPCLFGTYKFETRERYRNRQSLKEDQTWRPMGAADPFWKLGLGMVLRCCETLYRSMKL